MKINFNKIIILGIIFLKFLSTSADAKEQICGNLASIVYYPQSNPPKIGCLYAYNTYGQTPFWLQVKQVVNGGILVSADDAGIYHYGFYNPKDIYIQTSKQFVDGQILQDKEIVKYTGYYDYITVLGARKRVYKFYRYGKYEIDKNVDRLSLEKYGFIEPSITQINTDKKPECIWNIISIEKQNSCRTIRDKKATDLEQKIDLEIESQFSKFAKDVTYKQWLYSEFYNTNLEQEIISYVKEWQKKLGNKNSFYEEERLNDPKALIQIYFYSEILDAIKGLKPDSRNYDGTINRSKSKKVYYNLLGKKYLLPIIDIDICRELYDKKLLKVFPYRIIYFYNKVVEQEYSKSKPSEKIIENHLKQQNKNFEKFINSYKELKVYFIDKEINKAEKAFKEKATQEQSINNDILFKNFKDFYIEQIEIMNKYMSVQETKEYYEQNYKISVDESEGILYFAPDYNYLSSNFKNYLTPQYIEWLQFYDKTKNDFVEVYAAIDLDTIVERILYLENFLKENPEFTFKNEVYERLSIYLDFYLGNVEGGNPYKNDDTNQFTLKYKKSLENFIQNHKDTTVYPKVKSYYDKIKKNNFVDIR